MENSVHTKYMTTEEIIKYLENGTIESMDAEIVLALLEEVAEKEYNRGVSDGLSDEVMEDYDAPDQG